MAEFSHHHYHDYYHNDDVDDATHVPLHTAAHRPTPSYPSHLPHPSYTTTALLTICVGVGLVYYFIVHPLWLHPLRRVPRAHWSVAFPVIGSWWIFYVRWFGGGRLNATVLEAHRRGRRGGGVDGGVDGDTRSREVVRLAYNELSVDCLVDGVRTVYGAGSWEKTDWYARRSVIYGVINMFLTVHHTPHSQKKRTLANIYSKSNLQVSPQLRANTTALLVNRFWPMIQSFSDAAQPVNIYDINNAFNMDSISAYVFGIRHSTNFVHDVKERRQIMHSFERRHAFLMFLVELSPRFRQWLERLRLTAKPGIIAEANRVLETWTSRMCDAADQYLSRQQHQSDTATENPGDQPVVYQQFKTGIDKLRTKDPTAGREVLPHIADPRRFFKPNGGGLGLMARNELHSEMFDHLDAGFGTSGVTLTYLYWEMSRNPAMQERLYQEFQTLMPPMAWPTDTPVEDIVLPDPKDIDSLPYLHAVVMETLRLHTPLPGQQPRISPNVKGGSTLGKFSGIPGGVKVSAMPYTLHRNETAFPDPEAFDPDRWLSPDEKKLKEMYRWFWAFGSGGRMCIGSHFAMQSMKTQVLALYSNWTTQIVDDSGMEKTDGYAAEPRGGELMLKFVNR